MKIEPLASKLRPTCLDDIFGQEEILGKDKMLRRMIDSDMLSSIILYGPPGTGKTTIASTIAKTTKCAFAAINATTAGKKDMQSVVDSAKILIEETNNRTILFIDEIHRFNKAQQDFLLPYVEDGTIILIGATTENPYFEVNGALLSRSQIFELKPLNQDAMGKIIDRAIDIYNIDAPIKVELTADARSFFITVADGDARQILNGLDLAIRTTNVSASGKIEINLDTAGQCIQRKVKQYDKDGDNHYDSISAYIESMKHSEVDAALYYLARMLDRGEDPKYIARRLIVMAARDIGLSNPEALNVAVNAFLAVERVGMPECADVLAMSTIFNSMQHKSNSVSVAYSKAMDDAKNLPNVEIPMTLKDESYKSAWKLGHGGVSDVFASEYHYDGFECMPAQLVGKQYFVADPNGSELEQYAKRYFDWCRNYKKQVALKLDADTQD